MKHTFWLLLIVVIILWYAAITLIVAFKGKNNIKEMIEKFDDE